MIYCCIRHLPSFVDKEFDDVSDAASYVFKEADRMFGTKYGLITNERSTGTYNDIPQEFCLQEVFQEFGDVQAWVSYGDVRFIKDLQLRKAIMMCIKIVIGFGFSMYDDSQSNKTEFMDFKSWHQWESEVAEENFEYAKDEFLKANNEDFDISKHKDQDNANEAVSYYDSIMMLEELEVLYDRVAVKLAKKIRGIRISRKHIDQQIAKRRGQDISFWMQKIIDLHDMNFDARKYIAEAYVENGHAYIDDHSVSPVSMCGFVFDADDMYADNLESHMNEMSGNYCIVPFCMNRVIDPEKGIIFETKDDQVDKWLTNIFSFKIKELRYGKGAKPY